MQAYTYAYIIFTARKLRLVITFKAHQLDSKANI